MLYSVEWLRALCPSDEADARLAEALTSRGLTVDAVDESVPGTALDVDIPANRPDCLGHLGLARELSAALGRPLAERLPLPEGDPGSSWARIEIDDPELCGRYTAGLARDLEVKPSPDWVVRRLEACGLRSINNVVDASNLVMLELGQPIHFFDLERVRGDAETALIRVRRATGGERLTTLDGVEHTLDESDIAIADSSRAIALGGVIGGAATEIHDGTRNVLIEAAHFRPQSVRATSRRLGALTDASYRFERGVDRARTAEAQALALKLLAELAGASVEARIVDVHPTPPVERELTLSPGEVRRLLGFDPGESETRAALEALGLEPAPDKAGGLRVRVPSWRPDLEREADLVEEVARHIGYDSIPVASVGMTDPGSVEAQGAEARARDLLARSGFHEAIGYSMIGVDEDSPFVHEGAPRPIGLTNPIAEPLARLRRSILPGLLRAADLNHRRGNRDVRLFEVGRVFLAREGELPNEPVHAGLVWSGSGAPPHWSRPAREVDLFDIAGLVEHLVDGVAPGLTLSRSAGAPAALHPGESATWRDASGRVVAWAGTLHPELRARYEVAPLVAEIDLSPLAERAAGPAQYAPISRFPAVDRDLSLVLAREIDFARLAEVLRTVEPPAPVEFSAIDRYEGAPLSDSEVALTVRFTLRPEDRTLTDDETEGYRAALLERLQGDLGVGIRG